MTVRTINVKLISLKPSLDLGVWLTACPRDIAHFGEFVSDN